MQNENNLKAFVSNVQAASYSFAICVCYTLRDYTDRDFITMSVHVAVDKWANY